MMQGSTPVESDALGRRTGLWIYLAIAGSMLLAIAAYFVASNKSLMFYDIGSDTFFAFYPLQVAVAQQLQNLHSISWSFELGLGSFVGNLLDPSWLLTGWLPVDWQIHLRLPIYLLKILLAGGFLYAYLRRLGISTYIAVMGGLGYAFSSYGMINSQWGAMHGTEFVQLAGYLFLFEWYLQSERRWTAVGAGVLVGLGNAFGLYLFAFVTIIYMVTRWAFGNERKTRPFITRYVHFGILCIAGLALVAALLLPAIYYFLDSPRVFGNSSASHAILSNVFSINDRATISSEIGGLLGKNLFGIGSHYWGWQNYFEGPGFYVGLLPLLCIPQLLGPKATTRERWLFVFAAVLISLYIIFPGFRYTVYAFGHPGFRFSTLLIQTLILIMGVIAIRRALKTGVWVPGLVIGAATIAMIAVAAAVLIPLKVTHSYVIEVLIFTSVYSVILGLAAVEKIAARPLSLALIAIMVVELSVLSVPSIVDRDMVSASGRSPVGSYNDGTEPALALVHAQETSGNIFRTEKSYRSVFLDDSLVQGYRGTQSYYFHGSSIPRFYRSMDVPFMFGSVNYVVAPLNRPLVLDFLAVKYMLSRDRQFGALHGLLYIGIADGISVFKRPGALPFARFVDNTTSEAAANALAQPRRDELLLHTVVLEHPDIVKKQLAATSSGTSASKAESAVQLHMARNNLLAGSVTTSRTRLLLLAMPFDRGWSAHVGDETVPLFRADYGLTAMIVPLGTHQLRLVYRPVGRRAGWWISACVLILLIVWPGRARQTHQRSADLVESD